MKRILTIALCCLLLTGCDSSRTLDQAIHLRQALLDGNGCSFQTEITADYGDSLHTFCLSCQCSNDGKLTFVVTAPESIAGISGEISDDSAYLTFDDKVLGFSLLADDQLSPVSAPWILIKTLRSGYIRYTARTEQGTHICVDDSYDDDALQIDIWLDDSNQPFFAEIVWQNRRILSMKIAAFTIL